MRKKSESGNSGAGSGRRSELVRIAYRHVAEKGFEGLRVRDVAREAGINHATLHYYFPTKEALIQEVVGHLLKEFQSSRAPRPRKATLTPLEEIHFEFEDMRYMMAQAPEAFVVITELMIRSRRDPAIAEILSKVDYYWRLHLVSLLERGIEAGLFRPGLDLQVTATAIMSQIRGIGYLAMSEPDKDRGDRLVNEIAAQVEQWLTGSAMP